ncbi:GlxA family transcriptional regulator [Chitinophaga filiformis]|uniref:Transcriptional regulator GlxA family, contains an amidase domain and an AraC-type DNA-binding HTH domain n=1 Tax=Chitinophaga filiformis TaxID=104663 RepID=A0A1G8AN33_CHIFI|nr:GlxA family transcriptional regulator [Chitinophaga filiformis]SDH21700.1 Transcriptional regulator GlxA family, contains an amidase domain and an AraC-type DNA-binding HTH domain [Chitinophaga filiformis]
MSKEEKHIVILVPSNSALMDMAGPLEVFNRAAILALREEQDICYIVHTVSGEKARKVVTSSFLPILCESTFEEVDYPIDTLILSGIPADDNQPLDEQLLPWIAMQAKQVRRICSVCSGTFMLARAGVLNGKRATTHWRLCQRLADMFPEVTVENTPVFVKDGNIYTSAGVTTGMDMALALVEEDMGRSFALNIARQMVLFLKRPGNQSQYSTMLEAQETDYEPVKTALAWLHKHLHEDITVERLAQQAAMSPRNFARMFVQELKITPARYVEKLRLEQACRSLTEKKLTQDEIAVQTGFGNAENMRKVFLRTMEVTPSQYRKRFRSSFS